MTPQSNNTCAICSVGELIAYKGLGDKNKVNNLSVCTNCDFVRVNGKTYSSPNMKSAVRLGTTNLAGRNFEIARMAALICQDYELSVTIHNCGVTKDANRILNIPMVSDVCSLNTDPNILSLNSNYIPGEQKYDVIILNETLQAFTNKDNLVAILNDLKHDGLCIASTDLNDGSNISESKFIEAAPTQSMWSGKSLAVCAQDAGAYIDFRVPKIAVKKKYRRKRYILFYRSSKIENSVRLYFSKTPHAPSEKVQ